MGPPPRDSRDYSPRRRSRSPPPRRRSRSPPRRRDDDRRRDDRDFRDRDRDRGGRDSGRYRDDRGPSKSLALPSQASLAGKEEGGAGEVAKVEKIEPNYAPSGALAAETNTFQGVVLKYNEPPEARKPVRSWRLYVFKGKEQVDLFHVHRQSAYLIGRDRIVADIPVEHPSTSKQHAVLQYRQVIERNEFGDTKTLTKPFMIDLDSANGTMVNDELIPPSRYYELKSNDVIKFAFSTREYVLLAEE
ncbi:smad nuclear-interacting protein 1 [Pseudohyphozyma bogoriensis]|nr:smad nuclear-interacting protein 1 [Pseudohyphozyma bogoriensis]